MPTSGTVVRPTQRGGGGRRGAAAQAAPIDLALAARAARAGARRPRRALLPLPRRRRAGDDHCDARRELRRSPFPTSSARPLREATATLRERRLRRQPRLRALRPAGGHGRRAEPGRRQRPQPEGDDRAHQRRRGSDRNDDRRDDDHGPDDDGARDDGARASARRRCPTSSGRSSPTRRVHFADEGLKAAVAYVPSQEAAGRVVAQAQPAGTELEPRRHRAAERLDRRRARSRRRRCRAWPGSVSTRARSARAGRLRGARAHRRRRRGHGTRARSCRSLPRGGASIPRRVARARVRPAARSYFGAGSSL